MFVDSDRLFDLYNSVIEIRVNLKFLEYSDFSKSKKYVALVDLKTYYNFIVNKTGEICIAS